MKECRFCVNKENCATCTNKGWRGTKFVPAEKVRKYFECVYSGIDKIGYIYRFNTTNPELVNTHGIYMYGQYLCPYCGERMYCIQDKETLAVIGYCCICDGARAEVKYEEEKRELERKHEMEMSKLESKYYDKLSFDTDKLIKIKHEIECKRYSSRHSNYFTTINGKQISKIEDIVG